MVISQWSSRPDLFEAKTAIFLSSRTPVPAVKSRVQSPNHHTLECLNLYFKIGSVCLCHGQHAVGDRRYFLAPCDKCKHTGHAQQQAASQASTDSTWRHPVWLPHSSLGFQRPVGCRSYHNKPRLTGGNVRDAASHACSYELVFVTFCTVLPVDVSQLDTVYASMQDECAWAIGNLAGGSSVCRDILRAKGAVEPLIALLKVVFELLFLVNDLCCLCNRCLE